MWGGWKTGRKAGESLDGRGRGRLDVNTKVVKSRQSRGAFAGGASLLRAISLELQLNSVTRNTRTVEVYTILKSDVLRNRIQIVGTGYYTI